MDTRFTTQSINCTICGHPAAFVNNQVIYGKPYGEWPHAWLCGNSYCGAYVGCQPGTDQPKGTFADKPTRQARKDAHAAFDPLFDSGEMSREDAYAWLAVQMGLSIEQCHISMFDIAQCNHAIGLSITKPRSAPKPRRYLAFDLEIAALLPEGETDWKDYRPLGITCAALAWKVDMDDGVESVVYDGIPRMTKSDCRDLVNHLLIAVDADYTIVTWNGLSFDFDILAEESGMHAECAELANSHVDPMFQVHCSKGFPVGLDAVSKGMGLTGKMEGVTGAKAPQLWADGQFETVLEYVKQDARSTLEVALAIEQRKGLEWIAKSGRRNSLRIPRLLTVKECLQLPLPNTSWMSEPMPRSKFVGWMEPRPESA